VTKYKLDVERDVDTNGDGGYILSLPDGFRMDDHDVCHTIGFDTMKELRAYARTNVIPCDCKECKKVTA
jgi:hypothetical protein